MNKGANHWASRRDFRIGQRKRGSRRELGAFWIGIERGQDLGPSISELIWQIMADLLPEDSDLIWLTRLGF